MIGRGAFHWKVPRGVAANVRWRRKLLAGAKDGATRRGLREMCRKDVLFFINAMVWQFNPKKSGGLEVGPFVTYGFQDRAVLEILECIEGGEDLLIQKSRQMGASWLLVIIFTWLHLFHPHKTLLFISRSEKAVEDATPNSLFWKVDFIVEHLPDWLKPAKRKRQKMYCGNEEMKSAIFGEASTGKANVGGNTTAMGIDEFSQIEEDYEVLHRTTDSTNCRIFNGTHLGTDTALYELSQRVDMRKLTLHWVAHPEYNRGMYRYDLAKKKVVFLRYNDEAEDVEECECCYEYAEDFRFVMDGAPTGGPFPGVRSPWYDRQCLRKGSDVAIAMDLDINPRGSVSQFFSPLMIQYLKVEYACLPYMEGDLEMDRERAEPIRFVEKAGGRIKLWCHLRNGKPVVSDYGAGADVSAGTGATPSCLSVANARTGEKVLEMADANIDPREFALLSVAICRWFQNEERVGAKVAWENHGPGVGYGKRLIELGYLNIYFRHREARFTEEITESPGWTPAGPAKRVLLEDYREALKSQEFMNRSEAALDECLSFRYDARGSVSHAGEVKSKDAAASRENHGDRVISDALCCKMIKGQLGAQVTEKKAEPETDIRTLAGRRRSRQVEEVEREAWA